MHQKKSTVLLGLSVAAISHLGLLSSSSATAAEAALEEVIVTAQKREQSLQDTAISISAFNELGLERMNVQNLEDLSTFIPNLRITSVVSDGITASIAMRGTFNRNPTDPNSENTVGMYMDGVYIGKSAGALMELADLQRIEVLRGPQGTLYGRNTIGGAINIVRNRPGEDFSGTLRAGVGNEGLFYSNGAIDVPALGTVGEGLGQLRSRISFLTRTRDGLVENVPSTVDHPLGNPIGGASDFGDIDRWSVGIILDWQINDSFTLGYSYDTSEIDQNGIYTQAVYIGEGSFGLIADYANPKRQDKGSLDWEDSTNTADIEGHSLTADWYLGDLGALGDVSLKSITAYRTVDSHAGYDLDGSNVSLLHFSRANDFEQFSQEFQFIGSTDSVKYVVGLYYSEEEIDFWSRASVFGAYGLPEGNGTTFSENDATAVYGQVDWQPAALDRLTLTLGGRYSKENKETSRSDFTGDAATIPLQTLPKLDFSEDTYMASAAWALTDDANIYLKFSEGYRSGFYDGQSGDPEIFDIPLNSEYMESWEIGFKSRWMEDRLQVNVAAFNSDYDDMLISVWDTEAATSRTQNAGEAEIVGVELEVLAQLSEALLLSLTYGYLDGEWDTYPDVSDSGEPIDLKDVAAFPYVPNSFTAALDYNFSPFNFGQLSFHIDYSYTDYYYAATLAPSGDSRPIDEARGEQRKVINARLALADVMIGDSSLEFSLWGKNLADEDIARSRFDAGNAVFAEWDEPLTYGGEVVLRF